MAEVPSGDEVAPKIVFEFYLCISKEQASGLRKDDTVGLCGDIAELGFWQYPLPSERLSDRIFHCSVPLATIDVKAPKMFSFKDIVWEHGNNREVAGSKGLSPLTSGIRSSHAIWHLEPINHYSTFYEGKLLWQQQRKIDDAYSVYVDYLLNVFQTENWTYYTEMHSHLKVAHDVTSFTIREYVEERTEKHDQVDFRRGILYLYIYGSANEVVTKYSDGSTDAATSTSSGWSSGWGTSSGWGWGNSGGGSWSGKWWNKKAHWVTNLLNLIVDNEAVWAAPDSETMQLVTAFATTNVKYWLVHGLRAIIDEENDGNDSFLWLQAIPFCARISKIQKTGLTTIEPSPMRHHSSDKRFEDELAHIVKVGKLLAEPELKFPLLASLVRNAPTIVNVVHILKADKTLKKEKATWSVVVDELEYKMNRYKWPINEKDQKQEMACLLKLIRPFPPRQILKTVSNALDSSTFSDHVEADDAVELVSVGAGALERLNEKEQNDASVRFGVTIQNWLIRLFIIEEERFIGWTNAGPMMSSVRKVEKIKRVAKLKKVFNTYNYLANVPGFRGHQVFLSRSLTTLLNMIDDRKMIVEELKKNKKMQLTPLVAETLEERAVKAVNWFAQTSDTQLELIQSTISLLDGGFRVGLCHSLLYTLLTTLCQGEHPTLQVLFTWSGTWIAYFDFFRRTGHDFHAEGTGEELGTLRPAWAICREAVQLLQRLSYTIREESCTLSDLQVTLGNVRNTQDLFTSCQIPPFETSLLDLREHTLNAFETRIAHLQAFVNIYCSGLKVAYEDLPLRLLDIRKNWDELVLGAVKDQFSELPIVPHLQWLFEHRASELFLLRWNALSTTFVANPNPARSGHGVNANRPELSASGDDIGQSLFDLFDDPREAEDERPIAELHAEIQELGQRIMDPATPAAENVQLNIRLERLVNVYERRNAAGAVPPPPPLPGSDIDLRAPQALVNPKPRGHAAPPRGALTLSVLVDYYIPAMKDQWTAFYTEIDTLNVTFKDLARTFGLVDVGFIQREISILAKTGGFSRQAQGEWVFERTRIVTDYKVLDGHRRRMKGLIGLTEIMKDLFVDDFKSGDLYKALVQCHETFEREWETQTLENTSAYIRPVSQIFDGFSDVQLDYLGELCSSDLLLAWFLEHTDTDDFNRLINIVKSNTDDVIALRAIAAMLSTRNLLSSLLYPESKFSSLRTFLNNFLGLDISSAAVVSHLKTVNEQFSFLIKLFSEKTLSPGMQACVTLKKIVESGSYRLLVQGRQGCTLSMVHPDVKLDMDSLIDLRNRLLLAEIPESELEIPKMIEVFIEQMKILLDINKNVSNLAFAGHFAFQKHDESFLATVPLAALSTRLAELQKEYLDWVDQVKAARAEFYFLNFFRTEEVHLCVNLLKDVAANKDRLLNILRLAAIDLTAEEIEGPLASWKDEPEASPISSLRQFGAFVSQLFHNKKPQSRIISQEIVSKGSRYVFEEGTRGAFASIVRPEQVLDLTLSLYVQKGRLPEPDEVLFCTKSTSFEDIKLIVLRWAASAKNNRQDRLYCVVSIENLNYRVQSDVAELTLSFPIDFCSSIVFVSGEADGQHLINALPDKLEVAPLADDTLQKLYATIGDKFSHSTLVFRSYGGPGSGKTNAIKSVVSTENLLYTHIPINGHVKAGQLIQLFEGATHNTKTAHHIDIGPTVDADLSTLLFQLIVIGVLHDSETGQVFHKNSRDALYLELANSYLDNVRELVYFAKLLPTRVLDVTPAEFSLDSYLFDRTDEGTIQVICQPNYELQFVSKYLQAFKANRFQNFEATDPDFHPDLEPDLEARECFDLLSEYCANPELSTSSRAVTIQRPSFILFSNFVKFMFHQFVGITYYEPLSNMVCAGALGRPDFKQFVIRFVIQTSYDFASRSVSAIQKPKKGDAAALNVAYYAEQFEEMRLWNESYHPFIFFNRGPLASTPAGLGILSLNPGIVNRMMHAELRETLTLNGFQFNKDYSHLTIDEALGILEAILGVEYPNIDQAYVLTIDNVMKMLSIQLRIRYGIPVIIMGETGCGKTTLVSYMCRLLAAQLFVLNCHGGIQESDILRFMEGPLALAAEDRSKDVYIFFDEINTCSSLSLFKNMICDGYFLGARLPSNVKFIAACNPYKLQDKSKLTENAGLDYEKTAEVAVADPDPLRNLIYRVHPLPESFLEYVWDYGALQPDIEKQYIDAMFQRQLDVNSNWFRNNKQFHELLVKLVTHSHLFIRGAWGELGSVSLRDVSRFIKLFNFFHRSMEDRNFSNLEMAKRATVLALSQCYYSRLSAKRIEYADSIQNLVNRTPPHDFRLLPGEFQEILYNEQHFYVEQMHPEEGIALNEALCENVFNILVCVLNKIPIFVVGKPGSSKSLAVELVASNLNGKTSHQPFFQRYPAVEVFSYQCSPLSTSDGIEQTFNNAIKYQNNTANTLVVVLLDEVGLAEQSPHFPLKVLHKLLENPEVSVVGISNWSLDLAKMNRAIQLSRPEPNVDDLKHTAMGIVSSKQLEAQLQSLAEAYYYVYKHQQKSDFFGLRDFYQTIKYLHRNMEETLTTDLLSKAIYRNFGGRNSDLEFIQREFFNRVGLNFKELREKEVEQEKDPRVIRMIADNLRDRHARHLMLLTHNSAMQILFEQSILNRRSTTVLFGSDFPGDQTDLQICLDIQQIKTCMAEGSIVVLVHAENLFESLYDMLNQHYTIYEGQRFVRIALGTHSRLCPVHENFRMVVMVEASQAYHQLAPPLLNRFEKQVLMRHDLLTPPQRKIAEKLKAWVSSFVNPVAGRDRADLHYRPAEVFVGFNDESISSLVLSLSKRSEDITEEQIFATAVSRLLWIATPEAAVRASQLDNWTRIYFNDQIHSGLPSLLKLMAFSEQNEALLHLRDRQRALEKEIAEFKRQLSEASTLDVAKQKQLNEEISAMIAAKEKELKELSAPPQQPQGAPADESAPAEKPKETQAQVEGNHQAYWHDEFGLQLLVITFSSISDDVRPIVKAAAPRAKLQFLKLHEFTSATDLTDQVKEFYESDLDQEDSLLVLQCDPVASSNRRINHAKYICEKLRADWLEREHKGSCLKHVLFVAHLNRSNATAFSFDFDNMWFSVLLDDLKPFENTTLSLSDLLRGTEMELVKQIEIKPMLQRAFRSCLARMIYPYQRTSSEIKQQIEDILSLFDDHRFMPALQHRLFAMLEQTTTTGEAKTWQENLARNFNELATSSSFTEALWLHLTNIVSNMFTQLLCTVDRNQNVNVYLHGSAELWMKMFQDNAICRVLALASQSSRFDVLSDGQAGHFTARFPFSYAFFNAIEGLKVEAEKLPGALSESLSRLLEVVFPSKLYDGLSEELLSAYLSDFIDMKVPSLKSLPRPLQVLVTRKILTKHLVKANQIVDFHSAFFDNEKRLNNTFALLDFFPALRSDYEALLDKLADADFPLTRLDHALLELVLRELRPRPEVWETVRHQYEWLQKTSDCTPAVNALLQLETSVGALFDPVRSQWRGLQLQRHFLRDVTLRLGLDKALSLDFAQLVNSHADFRLLDSFLAVKAFLLTFVEKHPDPNAARPAASGLLEIYVSEFVLRASPIAELQTELLRALLTIVVGADKDFVAPPPPAAAEKTPAAGPPAAGPGKKVGFFDQLFGRAKEDKKEEPEQARPTVAAAVASALANIGRHLLASAAMKTYLLRTILQASNATVEQELVTAFADQPIQAEGCILLVQVVEDLCQLSADWLRPQVYENIEAAKLESPVVLQRLRSFGHARYFLVNLASAIAAYMDTPSEPTPLLVASAKLANVLLSLPGPTYRTFLLKQITKLKGVAAAQAFLNSPVLEKLYTFFPDWKKDVKVNRFLRTKHVLNNPFQAEPNWAPIREAVQKAVEGNLKPLEALLQAEAGNGGFRGTLLLAVFQECSLLYTAQLVPHAEIEALFNLIQASSLPPFEKNICQAFMTNKFPGPVAPIFTITPETSKDNIMLISVILQAVAAGLKQDGGLYRLLWENPQSLHDWYVPTMPQDARQALIAVLGGGWYECPNGHTYYVDACGRPTEILSCATCGAKIGGLDHVLDTTNKLSDRADRSRPGIILQEVLSEGDIYTSERELQPSVYRLLQFVMNSIMFLAAWGGSPLVREQLGRSLFPDAPHRDPTELLAAHVQFDWTLLARLLALSQEDLATLLGLVITVIQQRHFSAQPLKATDARVAYENAVKATVTPLFEDARGRLALFYRNSTEGDSLLAELRETADVGTGKQIVNNPAQPLLWRFRTAISLASLTQEFESDVANHERFPILRLFLTQEEKLRAVKYFKKALDWQNMLTVRLDKRIDREYAAQTTVAEFLASLPREELHRWEAAWLGYKEAWNLGWRHVDRYTCAEIAEGLKGIVMDETLPLVFSLPDDKDEGACPLTLTHALADIHNQFIENLNELLKRRNKYFEGMEEFRIPTHLLAESHLIVYNVETELLPLVQMQAEQSLEYGHGTDVRYNFPRIEQHLIDTILSGKPLIDLEVRKFNFSNETLMAGTLLSLKAQIHQIELPGELKEKIVEDLGALSRLRNCKHQLEICMGFLAVTVGTNQLAGSLLLSDYAKNTLMLDATDFGPVVSKTVQLQHMVSLFMLLEENLNVDAFVNVAPRYKEELEHHHLVALEAASSKIDLRVVVAVLKDTLTLRLGDDAVMPAHLTLFEVLAESDDPSGTRELGSLDWFGRFPKELQLKHTLHAYKFLATLIK